jgi:hypothetical protein
MGPSTSRYRLLHFHSRKYWKNSTAQLLTDSEISDSSITTFSGTKELPNPSWTTEVETQRARLQLLPLGLSEPRNHNSWQSVFGLISWDVPSMAVYLITVAMGWSSLNTGWILKHTNLQCHKSSPHKSISNEKVGKLNSFQEPISLYCYSEDEELKHDSSFCGYKSSIQLIQSASDYNQYTQK